MYLKWLTGRARNGGSTAGEIQKVDVRGDYRTNDPEVAGDTGRKRVLSQLRPVEIGLPRGREEESPRGRGRSRKKTDVVGAVAGRKRMR